MLVVALDPPHNVNVVEWIERRYNELKDLVQGFKLGLPAIIRVGVEGLGKIFKDYSGLLIADLKLADIGDIMAITASILKEHGFNAVIAHAFVGYRQAVDELSNVCRKEGLRLILVVSMSHKGSEEFLDKHLEDFIEVARAAGSWGLVAPATRPLIIKKVREIIGKEMRILSPGVGVQGAEPGMAICYGADYEIVGRAITYADNVRQNALKILESQRQRVAKCHG
ncbi:MAG: orotidine-5'-phosphate decarboxylase [Ignisphaera sp.]